MLDWLHFDPGFHIQ